MVGVIEANGDEIARASHGGAKTDTGVDQGQRRGIEGLQCPERCG
jgi:hypothetical protein